MPSPPFRRLPFDQVPEQPRVPHRWADAERRDITICTDDVGEIRIAVLEIGPSTAGVREVGPSAAAEARPLLLVHGMGMGTAGYSSRRRPATAHVDAVPKFLEAVAPFLSAEPSASER
jgi:hypothetical protein